jgi:hypothetical protein
MSGPEEAVCWMTGTRFQVGDIVTRGGDDRQRIVGICDGGDMIDLVVI